MKMTEDIIKNLPVLTEEEMKEISLTKEELIEKANDAGGIDNITAVLICND